LIDSFLLCQGFSVCKKWDYSKWISFFDYFTSIPLIQDTLWLLLWWTKQIEKLTKWLTKAHPNQFKTWQSKTKMKLKKLKNQPKL